MATIQIIRVIHALINFYELLVVVCCVLSWLPLRDGSLVADIAGAIDRIVSPYMNLFRRFIPPLGGIDFSPVVAILVLSVLENFAIRMLMGL